MVSPAVRVVRDTVCVGVFRPVTVTGTETRWPMSTLLTAATDKLYGPLARWLNTSLRAVEGTFRRCPTGRRSSRRSSR